MLIKGIWFGQIADIDCKFIQLTAIFDAEVIPRGMSSCIGVYPKEEVKLAGFNLDNAI